MFSSSQLFQPLLKSAMVLLVTVACAVAIAQPPPGGRGSRSQGGPGSQMMEALNEAMRNACGKEILDMLRFPPVVEEIELSEELQEKLKTMRRDAGSKLIEIFREQKPDLKRQIETLFKELSTKAFQEIEKSAGPVAVERLYGLFMQHRRAEAIGNRLVAKKVGLSDEELKAFRTRVDVERKKREAAVKKIMGTPNLEFKEKRKRLEEQMRSMREASNKKLLESLSEEQQEKFEKLQGEPFDKLPRRWHSGPRGGRTKERPDSGRPKSESGAASSKAKDKSGQAERNCCIIPFYYSDAFLSL